MTATVFVDTNVFVYWRDASEPGKQARATEWLSLLWHEQRGRTSAQVLSEFYAVVVRKKSLHISSEDAWRDVQSLLAWNPRPIDNDLLSRAHAVELRYRLNWWDSLIVAAAQAQGCAMLLTEDMQDGADYGGVTVRNPFTLGVAEEHTVYAPLPKLASRHRGRGRPRGRPKRAVPSAS